MHRADLEPGSARLVEAVGKGVVAALRAFAGRQVDEIGAIALEQAPVDRGIVHVGPGPLDRKALVIGPPHPRLPPQQARAHQRRQQQRRQSAPQRRIPASSHERDRPAPWIKRGP
jgi:hypothetical protein